MSIKSMAVCCWKAVLSCLIASRSRTRHRHRNAEKAWQVARKKGNQSIFSARILTRRTSLSDSPMGSSKAEIHFLGTTERSRATRNSVKSLDEQSEIVAFIYFQLFAN